MASTNLIGDTKTVIANGPSSVTTANAIAAAGPIMDYPGNTEIIIKIFKEALALLTYVLDNTDNGTDGANRTLLLGIQSTLS